MRGWLLWSMWGLVEAFPSGSQKKRRILRTHQSDGRPSTIPFVATTSRLSASSTTIHTEQDTSDTVIHISNLDWFAPKEVIANKVREILPTRSMIHHSNNHNDNPRITFKELPSRRKPRDQGKFHAGSATIAFDTVDEARQAWEALQRHHNATTTPLWRLRWAPLYNSFAKRQRPVLSDHSATVSSAVLERRRERAAQYARRRQRVAAATDTLIDTVQQTILRDDKKNPHHLATILQSSQQILQAPPFEALWEVSCPRAVDPIQGGLLRGDRGLRKRAAVEAFWYVLQEAFLPPRPTGTEQTDDDNDHSMPPIIADLGCGSGNLGLPLAWWLSSPQSVRSCRLRAVDMNQESLSHLLERAQSIGLTTVETLHANLAEMTATAADYNDPKFSLSDCAAVVSLHACGVASDLSIAVAVSHNLPFAISPCCIGKVKRRDNDVNDEHMSYPRSQWLRGILTQTRKNGSADDVLEDYELLANAADYAGNSQIITDEDTAFVLPPNSFGEYLQYQSLLLSTNSESARRHRCQAAKRIVEMDRLQWAVETSGYKVRLLELPRLGPNYAKRQLLLGAPAGSTAAQKIMQLPALSRG